ncbi:VpsF family polysaccharide biosynthesis protein [Devosia sp.]|uniref:VpsF family polysaccharide biosynthesis protein n=1 Tax=Devosia sp. TaxID=1871048 RepID=UPI00292CFE3B|nr:VpsF family polysaccharide biosynthesis protein [Devosia sp.]
MSYSAVGPDPSAPAGDRRRNAVTLLLVLGMAVALAVRVVVSPMLMDRMVTYTEEGGAFYEKLHFGTYLIFLMLPLALFSQPFGLKGEEIGRFKALLWYCLAILALVVVLFVSGRPGSSVFLIDTYLVAGAAGLIVLALGRDARRLLAEFVLLILIVSAVIGIGEALTQRRLLPYDLVELTFRPLGLSEHPLALGALCATAVGFVALTQWRIWVRVAAIFVLFVGCAASGARFALLLTIAEILVLLVFLPWPRLSQRQARRAKALVLLATLVGGTIMIGLLAGTGLLSRFGDTLFDENFYARLTVYQVFSMVGWQELLFGMPPADLLALVNEKLNLPFIESAQVVIGLTFGIPLALVFTWIFGWITLRLLRGAPLAAWIGTATFVLAALSNNTLSAKQPMMTIIFVLLLALAIPRQNVGQD